MVLVIVQDSALKQIVRSMYQTGQITLKEYAACLRRWQENYNG